MFHITLRAAVTADYKIKMDILNIIVLCPRAGLSLQIQTPRLQFFHRKLRNLGCSFTRDE